MQQTRKKNVTKKEFRVEVLKRLDGSKILLRPEDMSTETMCNIYAHYLANINVDMMGRDSIDLSLSTHMDLLVFLEKIEIVEQQLTKIEIWSRVAFAEQDRVQDSFIRLISGIELRLGQVREAVEARLLELQNKQNKQNKQDENKK